MKTEITETWNPIWALHSTYPGIKHIQLASGRDLQPREDGPSAPATSSVSAAEFKTRGIAGAASNLMFRSTSLYRALQRPAFLTRTMSTLPKPLPVVLCGKSAAVGGPVSGLLQPDYEGMSQPPLSKIQDPKTQHVHQSSISFNQMKQPWRKSPTSWRDVIPSLPTTTASALMSTADLRAQLSLAGDIPSKISRNSIRLLLEVTRNLWSGSRAIPLRNPIPMRLHRAQ